MSVPEFNRVLYPFAEREYGVRSDFACNYAMRRALRFIHDNPGCPTKSVHTGKEIITRLKEHGFVSVGRKFASNGMYLSLTDKGRELLERMEALDRFYISGGME